MSWRDWKIYSYEGGKTFCRSDGVFTIFSATFLSVFKYFNNILYLLLASCHVLADLVLIMTVLVAHHTSVLNPARIPLK
jgi:hypothetical protein